MDIKEITANQRLDLINREHGISKTPDIVVGYYKIQNSDLYFIGLTTNASKLLSDCVEIIDKKQVKPKLKALEKTLRKDFEKMNNPKTENGFTFPEIQFS